MTRASNARRIPDGAENIELRSISEGAETSSFTCQPVRLDTPGSAAYWADASNPLGAGELLILVTVTALSVANADETYTLTARIDDTSDVSDSPATVASITLTGPGNYLIGLDRQTLDALDAEFSTGARYLTLAGTLGGTDPALTFGAWIVAP